LLDSVSQTTKKAAWDETTGNKEAFRLYWTQTLWSK
jgi:hypothetical protein